MDHIYYLYLGIDRVIYTKLNMNKLYYREMNLKDNGYKDVVVTYATVCYTNSFVFT